MDWALGAVVVLIILLIYWTVGPDAAAVSTVMGVGCWLYSGPVRKTGGGWVADPTKEFGSRCTETPSDGANTRVECEARALSLEEARLDAPVIAQMVTRQGLKFPLPPSFFEKLANDTGTQRRWEHFSQGVSRTVFDMVYRVAAFDKVISEQILQELGIAGTVRLAPHSMFYPSILKDSPQYEQLVTQKGNATVDEILAYVDQRGSGGPDMYSVYNRDEYFELFPKLEAPIKYLRGLDVKKQTGMELWWISQYRDAYSGGHANSLVIDYDRRIVFWFEPNVGVDKQIGIYKIVIMMMTYVFEPHGFRLVSTHESSEFPIRGIQVPGPEEDVYCATWSRLGALIYAANPGREPSDLFAYLIGLQERALHIVKLFLFHMYELVSDMPAGDQILEVSKARDILDVTTGRLVDLSDMFATRPECHGYVAVLLSIVDNLEWYMDTQLSMDDVRVYHVEIAGLVAGIFEAMHTVLYSEECDMGVLQKLDSDIQALLPKYTRTRALTRALRMVRQEHASTCVLL
jgi:hypothetical protein